MRATVPTLTAPILLIAMPQVHDPFFARTVVLLVHHDAEGSLGYVVNRPIDVRMADLCQGLGIPWAGGDDAKVRFGGPVQTEVGAVLYRGALQTPSSTTLRVAPELLVTANREDLRMLASEPPAEMMLLLGYAGWGPGQIDAEFLRGDWLTADALPELIFCQDGESAWRGALASIGVDPGALPTRGEGESGTVN